MMPGTHRAALAAAVALLQACAAHGAAAPHAAAPSASPAPVPARTGDAATFGVVHFPVSCTPEAQQAFDLAVSQQHSFFYPETVKSFTHVAELDPTCAMAYWGIAFAQMPNPLVPPFEPAATRRAREAVDKGLPLARTERERDWLLAVDALFRDADATPHGVRVQRYADAMQALAARHPDDAEAQIFLALALLQATDPHDKTYARPFQAARILMGLEASHPDHPGIAHYEIHAFDHSPIASQGLAAADAYAAIAPRAPHAVHMPSHVYSMLGMWDRSIASNLATLEVAREYAERNFPPGVTHSAASHSLDFLEYAYLQEGRDQEARGVVEQAAAIRKMNVSGLAQATGLAAIPVRFALERGAWGEAAALEVRTSPFPYAEALGRFGRAVGGARLGTAAGLVEARDEIAAMKALRMAYLATPDQGFWADQVEVLTDAASGWLARAEGDDAGAVRWLRAGADLEDASVKHVAMENRVFPVREQLGYLLLELGRAEEALAEFRVSLAANPNRLRGWYGAARAAEAAGYPNVARDYGEQLRRLTEHADGRRAEVAYGRDVAGPRP